MAVSINKVERINKQANSRHCFVCGIDNLYGLKLKFYTTEAGDVIAECKVPDHYQGYPGVVHGGIVAAMLDEVAGRAFMGEDPPRFMFTAKLDIRYRKNVPVGENLRVIGQVLKNKERIAIAKSMIYNQQSEILAEAEVLLVDIPPDTYKDVDLAVLGWKVYPD